MKTPVKSFTLLISAPLLMGSTCQKDELASPKNIRLNSPFEIPLDGEVLIDSGSIQFNMKAVSDSRCPVDVQCFWAGNAKVSLTISEGTGEEELSFCIGQCDTRFQKADTLQIRYKDKPYQLILTDVKPYPGKGDGKKSAVFILQKK